MSPRLRLVGLPSSPEATPADEPVQSASSFVRQIDTPAALPWRQHQLAEMEARFGSPAPIAQLSYRVRRVEAWRPGVSGCFLVDYSHAPLGTKPQPQGSLFQHLLPSQATLDTQTRKTWPIIILLAVFAIATPYLALSRALSGRQDTVSALTDLEQRTSILGRRARSAAARAADAAVLDRMQARELSPAQVLQDFNWVSTHRRPEVTVSAIHWSRGISAVEVTSETPPFDTADRRQERAAHALRPGVWLWGVATSDVHRP